MAIIYKITNKLNGKAYIGFSTKSLEQRIKGHLWRARSQEKHYLHNAIIKWGWENFECEVLKDDATKEDEIRLIEEHQTYWEYGGYNLTKGGDGTTGYIPIVSEQRKKELSVRMKGENNPFYGKRHSESTKAKMRENHKSGWKKGNRHTPEAKEKIKLARKNQTITEEMKQKYREKNSGLFEITHPDGRKEIFHSLRQYCKQHKIGRNRLKKQFNLRKLVPSRCEST
jgi:group I intron endonuclease